MTNCDLCNVEVYESSIQFQNGYYLCLNCVDEYSDSELEEKIKSEGYLKKKYNNEGAK